ncbi:STAS domain-containing protein [Actinoplanes sp. NPDC051513]|uniref:STAS domain-containing protein n=1 Tax=Actinoplanes sp. NPDC051513 TaxID=3363908 RepID=UPI0037896AD3
MITDVLWSHEVRHDADRVVVVLAGELDMTGADGLLDLLRAQVRAHATVEVDAAGVTFIDSSAVGSLITGYRAASERGGRLMVANPSPVVRRVLSVTGVLDALTL